MESPVFKIKDKVVCMADYHSNEELRLRAKENMIGMPKKNQVLTVSNIVFCSVDKCCYLQFEEIQNDLVNGEPVVFYQLNFGLTTSAEKSLEFSSEIINKLEEHVNNNATHKIQKQNCVGKLKMSDALIFLQMIAIDYKLDLRTKGFNTAKNIFKRSVQFN